MSAKTARGKLSYGWVVAILGAFVLFIAGNFQYTFGVLVKPLIDRFGWSRAAISGGVTARSIAGGLVSPIAGTLGDRYGHRKLILIGIILVGLSFLLAAYITSLWQLYVFLGMLAGIGMSFIFVPLVSVTTQWFGTKSGLANGIVLSGFGWAQIIIPPAATYLILQYSWETCLIVLGIAVLVSGTVAWHFIRTPPSIMPQPLTEPGERDNPEVIETTARAMDDFTLSEALRTPALWQLFVVLLVTAACFQLVVIHIIVAAIDIGITPEAAAIILTISGVTNTAGRLILGYLSTKIGNKVILAFCLAVQAVVLLLLAGVNDLHGFYILAAVYGLVYGGVFPLMPTLTGSLFGTRSMGAIFGIINAAYPLGGAIGPLLGGYIFDVTGSYQAAFTSAAIATVMVFVLCLLLKAPRRKSPTSSLAP